jgi:hypothetical protein
MVSVVTVGFVPLVAFSTKELANPILAASGVLRTCSFAHDARAAIAINENRIFFMIKKFLLINIVIS